MRVNPLYIPTIGLFVSCQNRQIEPKPEPDGLTSTSWCNGSMPYRFEADGSFTMKNTTGDVWGDNWYYTQPLTDIEINLKHGPCIGSISTIPSPIITCKIAFLPNQTSVFLMSTFLHSLSWATLIAATCFMSAPANAQSPERYKDVPARSTRTRPPTNMTTLWTDEFTQQIPMEWQVCQDQ